MDTSILVQLREFNVCSPDAYGEDVIALDDLEEEIDNFKKWAENGISELARLATDELAKDKKQ